MMEHKWKKASPELGRVLETLLLAITCDRKMMFGSPVFMINRNMFTGVHENNIFLRLSETDRQVMIKQFPGMKPFEPLKGRIMKEYIVVPKELYENGEAFREWLKHSHAFAFSLPPKKKKK
jgi:TfoX/Sxy family transcriptional regulator of competence genes